MKKLSRAYEWAIAGLLAMVALVFMLGRSTSDAGLEYRRLATAKELCGVPGSSGVDMNVSLYYMKMHPKVQLGEVGIDEKWEWYRSQLDGYTAAELSKAGCDDTAVERREIRATRRAEASDAAAAKAARLASTERRSDWQPKVGGCTRDPRELFIVGQRVSGAEIRRRLELNCPGSQLLGTTAVVVDKGTKVRVELDPQQPLVDDYYTVKRVEADQ